jgi:hypothetical protein
MTADKQRPPEPDRPRLLSARPGADYVDHPSRAMRGEPEALSEADLAGYVDEAHDRDEQRDQASAEALRAAMLDMTRQVTARFEELRDALHRPEARTSRSARDLARRIDRDLERLAREIEHLST